MAARHGRSVDVPDAEPIAQKESSAAELTARPRPRCRRHECLPAGSRDRAGDPRPDLPVGIQDARRLPAMAQATATSTMAINKPPHQNPAQPSNPAREPRRVTPIEQI